jgi:hypothetical protein
MQESDLTFQLSPNPWRETSAHRRRQDLRMQARSLAALSPRFAHHAARANSRVIAPPTKRARHPNHEGVHIRCPRRPLSTPHVRRASAWRSSGAPQGDMLRGAQRSEHRQGAWPPQAAGHGPPHARCESRTGPRLRFGPTGRRPRCGRIGTDRGRKLERTIRPLSSSATRVVLSAQAIVMEGL